MQLHVDGVWGHIERLGRTPTQGQRKLRGPEQYGIPRGVIEYILGWNPHAPFMIRFPSFTSAKSPQVAGTGKGIVSPSTLKPIEKTGKDHLYERHDHLTTLPPVNPSGPHPLGAQGQSFNVVASSLPLGREEAAYGFLQSYGIRPLSMEHPIKSPNQALSSLSHNGQTSKTEDQALHSHSTELVEMGQ